MAWSCHIRDFEQAERLTEFPEHLANLYDRVSFRVESFGEIPCAFDRIYVGDEFCIHRVPSLKELEGLCRLADRNGWRVTFLSPPLTDEGMDRISILLDWLKNWDARSEVVVNDWGVLLYFRDKYPSFSLSLGRLLNKGFKDPRLPEYEKASSFLLDRQDLIDRSTFDFKDFQENISALGVSRLERDMLPYGENSQKDNPGIETSFYFPFGYITTGRVCWMTQFNSFQKEKFIPPGKCTRICNTLSLDLTSEKFSIKIFQGGNTVFYLYTRQMLSSLFERARKGIFRLVYQGMAIGL